MEMERGCGRKTPGEARRRDLPLASTKVVLSGQGTDPGTMKGRNSTVSCIGVPLIVLSTLSSSECFGFEGIR